MHSSHTDHTTSPWRGPGRFLPPDIRCNHHREISALIHLLMRGGVHEKDNRNSGNVDHDWRNHPERAGRGALDRSGARVWPCGRRDRGGRRWRLRAVLLWTGLRLLRSALLRLLRTVLLRPGTLRLLWWTGLSSPLLASLLTNVAGHEKARSIAPGFLPAVA